MELKTMINMIAVSDAKRAELAVIKSEYRELFKQYRVAKSLMDKKQEEEFNKERDLHNCSHPLSIMYNYAGFDLTHFNRECVCCGYFYGDKGFKFPDEYLDVETLLFGEEPTELCELIRQRLSELSKTNPNISLEEAKSIIASELPEIEKTIVESRKAKSENSRKRVKKDVVSK